ncbi:hypothetical protein L204_102586 [Cryptococcus depauperatus]
MSQPIFPSPKSQDHRRPSLFDLLAQEQLRDLFHPVVHYILSYFAQRYPRYLLRLLNYHEETFALLLLLLERHHLKRHNASIAEHFYGLEVSQSVSVTPRLSRFFPTTRGLTRKQRWGMLVYLVGLPWARARLQDLYERLNEPERNTEGSVDVLTTTQRIFKVAYPYANLGLELVFLGYDIAYLFEKTSFYRPWHKLLGLKVTRVDSGAMDQTRASSFFSKLPPLLPPLLLLLKLSQWWYSPTSPRSSLALRDASTSIAAIHAGITPPRPLRILRESGLLGDKIDDHGKEQEQGEYKVTKERYGTCPLCGKKWQNPAILPSGWVVCWRCGWDTIQGEDDDEDKDGGLADESTDEDKAAETKTKPRQGVCPITGIPVAPGQLRRVLV